MKFTKGNLALQNHLDNGRRVFLFKYVQPGHVKFVTELVLFDTDYFETHDRNGDLRTGIKFFFSPVGAKLYIKPDQLGEIQARDSIETLKPNVTERAGLVTSRVGQGAYRKSILHRFEYRCAVTRFNDPRVLIASHIVPWRDSTDEQRLDVDNGILLSPCFDALFDKHLITFNPNGKIILSDQINPLAYQKIGVFGKEKLLLLNDGMKAYLNVHQNQFNQVESAALQ